MPVLLGEGIPLFLPGQSQRELSLPSVEEGNGVVRLDLPPTGLCIN